MPAACSCAAYLSSGISGVASHTGFALRSSSLFGTGIRFRDAFSKEDEIPKGISEKKFFEAPWLGLRGRLDRVGRQILLVQGFDIGHCDPAHTVPPGAVREPFRCRSIPSRSMMAN